MVTEVRKESSKERGKRERRDDILRAAVRVFLDRGVASATMDDIAREVGLSKGALYLYFASKDDLFLSIALEWLEQLETHMTELFAQEHDSGIALLRAGAKAYVTHALSCRGRYQVAMGWLNSSYSVDGSSERFQKYRAAIGRTFAFATNAIDRAKADGSLDTDQSTPRLALQLWGSIVGLIFLEHNSSEMARRLPISPPTSGICHDFIERFLASAGASPHTVAPLKPNEK